MAEDGRFVVVWERSFQGSYEIYFADTLCHTVGASMRQISAPQVWPSIVQGARREAPRIVAKDVSPSVTFVEELGDGDFLALESPGLADVSGRLVRRNAALEPLAVLPNLQTAAALSPNRRWLLAGGPCLEAEVASAVLVDVAEWRAVRTLPLRPPFAWLDDQRFIAQTPRFRYETKDGCLVPTTRLVDPALVATAGHLLDIVPGLVLVDRTTLDARLLLASESFRGEDACALSADGSILFSATNFARTSPFGSRTDAWSFSTRHRESSPKGLSMRWRTMQPARRS